jgi:hypothetical protein
VSLQFRRYYAMRLSATDVPVAMVGVLGGCIPVLAAMAFAATGQLVAAVSIGAIAGAITSSVIAAATGALRDTGGFTPWDAAGVFALIGFGAGMIASPDSVTRYFGLS